MTHERHDVVRTVGGVRIVAMDSITHANDEFGPSDVLVGASFAGVVAVQFAARYRPRGVIAHDCGVGREAAGINGLWYLEGKGIPAGAVDSMSARIADGVDTWERGIISRTNHWAELLGVRPGQTVREAAARLSAWDMSEWPDDQPRERREVVADIDGCAIAAMDSIRFAIAEDARNVVCIGSHGGRTAAAYALEIQPRGLISSDGGIGADDSGRDGLAILQAHGIPAAAVGCQSARIGVGASTYTDGVISTVNDLAADLGLAAGMPAADAARLMAVAAVRK